MLAQASQSKPGPFEEARFEKRIRGRRLRRPGFGPDGRRVDYLQIEVSDVQLRAAFWRGGRGRDGRRNGRVRSREGDDGLRGRGRSRRDLRSEGRRFGCAPDRFDARLVGRTRRRRGHRGGGERGQTWRGHDRRRRTRRLRLGRTQRLRDADGGIGHEGREGDAVRSRGYRRSGRRRRRRDRVRPRLRTPRLRFCKRVSRRGRRGGGRVLEAFEIDLQRRRLRGQADGKRRPGDRRPRARAMARCRHRNSFQVVRHSGLQKT